MTQAGSGLRSPRRRSGVLPSASEPVSIDCTSTPRTEVGMLRRRRSASSMTLNLMPRMLVSSVATSRSAGLLAAPVRRGRELHRGGRLLAIAQVAHRDLRADLGDAHDAEQVAAFLDLLVVERGDQVALLAGRRLRPRRPWPTDVTIAPPGVVRP